MKRINIILMAFALILTMSQCKKDVVPTISIVSDTNYAGQNTEVFTGDLITVGFSVAGENLIRIDMNITQNGTVLYADTKRIDNLNSYLYIHNFTLETIGTVNIIGTVTDIKGHTATTSFDIICCKKDIYPVISIATGSNYISQNTEVFSGDPITVGFNIIGDNLTNIEMNASHNGTVLYANVQSINNVSEYLYTHNFTVDAIGTVTITGIVTDAKGHTATESFDIICYERPNAKFVGHYEGDILINGIYDIELSNIDSVHNNITDLPFAAIADIVASSNANEVLATITINDHPNTVTGIVDNNKVTFNPINGIYTINYDYNGYVMPIIIDMTYYIFGTLNNGKLELGGNCEGYGEINVFFINGSVTMEGIIGGSLDKME